MRLICPNCGAQYEVDDDVIPQDGRDVQCSNCGHTWFEGPDSSSVAAEENEPVAPAVKPTAPEPSMPDPTPMAEAAAEPETVATTEPEPEIAEDVQPASKSTATTSPRPPLDSSIADILREEAAREEAARRADTNDGLQSQGDLGLTDPTPAASVKPAPPSNAATDPGQERLDRLRGSPSGATPMVGARSEMFPDIEEINSTLRSSAERGPMAMLPEEEASNRRSGRLGFFGMLALIVILMAIYVYADSIAQAIPALGDVLASYVAALDQARLWLDEKVQAILPSAENT